MRKEYLSVIVCTYNRAKQLKECLNSLIEQSLDKNRYEIVVVDNNSNDNTWNVHKDYSLKYHCIRYVFEPTQGLAYARNKGLREAEGEYIAYIDDDCIATPNWCNKIIECFQLIKPRPDVIGGRILPRYYNKPPGWFSDDLEIRSCGDVSSFLEKEKDIMGFSGANMAFYRETIIKVGYFSNNFGIVKGNLMKGEETELLYRLMKGHSHIWFEKDLIVYHKTPPSSLHVSYRIRDSYYSGISFARINTHRFMSMYVLFRLVSFLFFLPEIIVRSLTNNKIRSGFVKALCHLSYRIGFIKETLLENISFQKSFTK